MNNKILYSAACLLMTSSLALTSCQSEEMLPGSSQKGEVLLTVAANRDSSATRTSFENDGNGGLTCNWSEGDQLIVANESGAKIGVVTLKSGEDTPNGVFEGLVDLPSSGKINLIYAGASVDADKVEDGSAQLPVNISAQDGSFASLTKSDILSSEVEVSVVNSEATATVDLNRKVAHGYFTLSFSDGVTLAANDVITVTGDDLYASGNFTFTVGGSIVKGDSPETSITVTKAEAGNAFYITMLPCGSVTPTFTVTKDGVEYTATLASHNWIEGEYVRKDDSNNPVEIAMTAVEVETVDHDLNPLAKWAEGNLVYDSTTGTSSISSDPYAGGSLYQWGRNIGFDDYADAMGTWSSTNYSYPYGTYGQSYYAGDGFETDGSDGYSKACQKYTTLAQLKGAGKAMFLIGSTDMTNGDYWQFDDDSTDWNSRATNGGFTDQLAPAGYRLPTTSDYVKIFPKDAINTTATGLSSAMSDLSELRQLETGEQYVIKWTLSTVSNKRVMTIKALMVSESFTESMLSSVDWTSSDVVTRYFPATGAIVAYYHKYVNSQYKTLEVLRPLPFGTSTATLQTYPDERTAIYWSVKLTNIVDAGKTYEGAYWCSDQKYIFRFRDNQNKFGTDDTNSLLGASSQPAQNAFAVRCIKE